MLKTNQRARAFYYICLSSFVAVLNNGMKIAWHDPRPYWVFAQVWPFNCQKGFGSPSGHTMWVWTIPMALTLDLKRSNPTGKCMFIVAIILTIGLGVQEAWTRMFLGVHTLD